MTTSRSLGYSQTSSKQHMPRHAPIGKINTQSNAWSYSLEMGEFRRNRSMKYSRRCLSSIGRFSSRPGVGLPQQHHPVQMIPADSSFHDLIRPRVVLEFVRKIRSGLSILVGRGIAASSFMSELPPSPLCASEPTSELSSASETLLGELSSSDIDRCCVQINDVAIDRILAFVERTSVDYYYADMIWGL
ncbi:hypothetical protein TKK_0007784 [Trichogramma kaykai]